MRKYDAVVIVDPRLQDADIQQAVDKLTKAIEAKGEVENLDKWGKKRLAFEIDHLDEGYYLALRFNAEPALISDLDRLLELGEEYIRHKIVRVP